MQSFSPPLLGVRVVPACTAELSSIWPPVCVAKEMIWRTSIPSSCRMKKDFGWVSFGFCRTYLLVASDTLRWSNIWCIGCRTRLFSTYFVLIGGVDRSSNRRRVCVFNSIVKLLKFLVDSSAFICRMANDEVNLRSNNVNKLQGRILFLNAATCPNPCPHSVLQILWCTWHTCQWGCVVDASRCGDAVQVGSMEDRGPSKMSRKVMRCWNTRREVSNTQI